MDKEASGPGAQNQYALFVEEAGGMHAIHNLQHHENLEIYKKSFFIMDKFFPEEDEQAETGIEGPQVGEEGNFAFQSDLSAPQGGFNFGGQ